MSNRTAKIVVTTVLGLVVGIFVIVFAIPVLFFRGCGTPIVYHAAPLDAALNAAVRGLDRGKIVFDYPDTMKQSERKKVEVRISRNLNQDITRGLINFGMKSLGPIKVEDITVGPYMAAALHGSAFQITPLTPEEQAVTEEDFTTWDWEVHPLEFGHQQLYLDVCVRLQLRNSREEKRCSPVYGREVTVRVDPVYEATHFVKDDPKWTGTTLVALIGAGIEGVRRWRKKRRQTVFNP